VQSDLGAAQLLIGQLVYPPRIAPSAAAVFHPQVGSSLFGPCSISVLDWCALLFDAAPTSVTATGLEAAGVASGYWEFDRGRGVHLTCSPAHRHPVRARLHVLAERGNPAGEFPDRLRWTIPDGGSHAQRLACTRPLSQVLLEQFCQAVRQGAPLTPDLNDAYRVLGWLRAARQSQEENRRITLP